MLLWRETGVTTLPPKSSGLRLPRCRMHGVYGAVLLALSPFSSLAQTSLEAPDVPSLKPVTVTAKARKGEASLDDSPAGIGHVTVLSNGEINQRTTDRLEDLLQQSGLATLDAGSSFGLGTGLGIRGFAINRQASTNLTATRVLLNGYPDIAYRFARDLSTVEAIEVLGGFDSTLAGAGAPGGTVQYISKRPSGTEFTELGSDLASDGLARLTFDAERHFGPLQVRGVLASQSGQHTAEGQPTNRDNVLLSALLATPMGRFQLDLEHQNNRAPYVFGTFYSQGQFWYDRPYVSPQSRAERRYDRAALDWQFDAGPDTQLRAWVQHADVKRDETLVGFWDIKNATLLDGYYRELRATASQLDTGVSVKYRFNTGAWAHALTTQVQRQTQELDFSGPQSISQFVIDIAAPQWPIDLTRLTLRPRTMQERYVETGLALADTIQISPQLEVRLGLRRSRVHIDTASNTAPSKPTADMAHTTASTALAWHFSEQTKAWVSRAESFEPVRGQMRLGGFLPAQTGTQWELGWKTQRQPHQWVLTAFDIRQKNLPGTDPVDRDYLVPVGNVHATGLSASWVTQWLGLDWRANITRQRVRVDVATGASQGDLLPGTPQNLGSLRISKAVPALRGLVWLQPFWVGKRPADDAGSLYAPGFVRWDAGAAFQRGNWHWSVALENALDKRYVQALSAADTVWQGPRRRLTLGMRVGF